MWNANLLDVSLQFYKICLWYIWFHLLLYILIVTQFLILCLGLSLKMQELTAIFLAVRLYCSFVMEGDIHTVLDFTTLLSTVWVIYMIRFKLKSSYIAELDNMPIYYLVLKHKYCPPLAFILLMELTKFDLFKFFSESCTGGSLCSFSNTYPSIYTAFIY